MSLSVEQMHHEKSLLLFRVEPYRICVPSVDVEAIITVPTFRSIPHAPFAMRGVFSYRGQIASVISLRRKFGLQDFYDTNIGQLILTRISCGLTGFWVDEVLDIVASIDEDVIGLPVLSRLTVFDHFLILDDQIAQHTTFEQIYQAPDATPRKRSPQPSALDQEAAAGQGQEADDRPAAGTAKVIQLDPAERAKGGMDPAVCGAADENARQPDVNEKGLEAPPGRKFDATADVVDLRSHRTNNQDASSTFRLKSRSAPTVIKRSKQSSHQSDRRQTAVATVNLTDRFSRGQAAYQSAADSHIQPGIAGRSTRQRRYSIFTAGILLLAGLILLTYWLWPQDKRIIPVSRGLETEKITFTADSIPTASSEDASRELWPEIENQQDTARSIPAWDNSAVAEKITGPVISSGEMPGDSVRELRSETEKEQNTAQPTPTWDDNAAAEKVTGPVILSGEIPGASAREPRSETEAEQNTARPTPIWDDNVVDEKVTDPAIATGEMPGDSAREMRSQIDEEQNAVQSNPDWNNSPVAEKASDSVNTTGEKVEDKIGNDDGGELMTYPATASQDPQTASVKALTTDESADQLMKIETDDFTLTIERGQSGKTHQPPQTGPAPAEQTGATEPSPTGVAPVVTTEYTHIVVKGDTLWDIAAKYLENPFRYPELADLSRIKDPHWIYPGDLIRIVKKKVPEARN